MLGQSGSKISKPEYFNKSFYYVEIKNKIAVDALKSYIDKYKNDFKSEGIPIFVIEYKNDSTLYYISAIIYRSDLNKFHPNYYTLIKDIPVLIYYRPNVIIQNESTLKYFRKLFYSKLLDDLDENGNINPDFIPVGFDPRSIKLVTNKDIKLVLLKNISMKQIYILIEK